MLSRILVPALVACCSGVFAQGPCGVVLPYSGVEYDGMGTSVCQSADWVFVGIPGYDEGGLFQSGAVAVYDRSQVGQPAVDLLFAETSAGSAVQAQSGFGQSVATDGNRLVVGCPREDVGSTNVGRVYVFEFDGVDWTVSEVLDCPTPGNQGQFGTAVAIRGDVIVATEVPSSVLFPGEVHLFRHDGSTWVAEASFSGPTDGDLFGATVALDGERVAVGAPGFSGVVANGGQVHALSYDGSAWSSPVPVMTGVATDEELGAAIDLSGDTLAIGVPGAGGGNQGTVEILVWDGASWIPEQTIPNTSLAPAGERFGSRVALHGDELVVGLPFHQLDLGAVRLFARSIAGWCEEATLIADDPATGFGGSGLAINGAAVLIGAADGIDPLGIESGAAFSITKACWMPCRQVPWSEGFEGYGAGSLIAGQGCWEAWSGTPAADAEVTTVHVYAGTQALSMSNPGGGAVDVVQRFDSLNSGTWTVRGRVRLDAAQTGPVYFILLNTYEPGCAAFNWSVQLELDAAIGTITNLGGSDDPPGFVGATGPAVVDAWSEIVVDVDFDLNQYRVHYGEVGTPLSLLQDWSSWSGPSGASELAALDLYAPVSGPTAFDDLFVEPSPTCDGFPWEEDFESLSAGALVGDLPCWTLWNPSVDTHAVVSDTESFSGERSLSFAGPDAVVDVVRLVEGVDAGRWRARARLHLSSTFPSRAYFLLLNTYAPGGPFDWSVRLEFDPAAGVIRNLGGFPGGSSGGEEAPLIVDEWSEMVVEIDLDANTYRVWYGPVASPELWVLESTWSSAPGVAVLQAIDFYADSVGECFFDDIRIEPEGGCDLPSGVSCVSHCDQDTVALEWSLPSFVEEVIVRRNGVLLAELSGLSTRFSDTFPAVGPNDYEVVGVCGGVELGAVNCSVIHCVNGEFALRLGDAASADGAVTTTVSMDCPGGEVQAWSLGVCHDPSVLGLDSGGVVRGAAAEVVNNGAPPDFEAVQILADGFTGAAVVDFMPDDPMGTSGFAVLPIGFGHELYVVTYDVLPGTVGATSLQFCESLGEPPVSIVVSSELTAFSPTVVDGSIAILSGDPEFVRGDCNGDGSVQISDAVFLLEYLFLPGAATPACDDACDANDDGDPDVSDAVYLLAYLFVPGSPVPESPFPGCGSDTSADDSGCDDYMICP